MMEEDYVSESFGLYEDQELIDALGMGRTPGQSLAPLVSEEAAQQESALVSTARGVAGGVRDAAQGFIDFTGEAGEVLQDKMPLGYVIIRDGNLEFSSQRPENMSEIRLPQIESGNTVSEGLVRGLSQFVTGMAISPVGKAGAPFQFIKRAAFAETLFDPEDGNLATLMKDLGVDNDFINLLDSRVGEDADAAERLKARIKQATTGTIEGAVLDGVVAATRAARSDEGFKQTIKNYFTEAGEKAEQRIADRGTQLTSGVDPTAAMDSAVATTGRLLGSPKNQVTNAKSPTSKEEGFIAFAGSPADFNRFSLSKIGTGEGHQQFGYGLYFSDLEDIARFYRDALSDRQPISLDDLDTDAPAIIENINITRSNQPGMGFLKESDPDFDEFIEMIEDSSVSRTSSPFSGSGFTDFEMKDGSVIRVSEGPDDALQETDPRVIIQALGAPTGKIYKVKINAIKDELIDQTKPLGKQPRNVMTALKQIGDTLTLDDVVNIGFDPFELGEDQATARAKEKLLDPNSDVLEFLSTMQSIRGSANAGEKALADRGIKGMRYLTGAARQRRPIKAEQNYVIFDDKIINILEKYGIVGPVAISSAAIQTKGQSNDTD
jgi:hypothetical protein